MNGADLRGLDARFHRHRESRVGKPSRKGYALIMVLGVIVLLALSAITATMTASRTLAAVSMQVYEKQAIRAAEAGLADALVALRANEAWTGFVPALRALPTQGRLAYSVEVTNNAAGSAARVAPDGTSVPAGAVYLRATGVGTRDVRRTVTALATRRKSSLFRYALFGDKGVATSGGPIVDAWDSSQGAYAATSVVPNAAGVGTNATTAGALSFSGGTYISGDLTVGPGADPAVAITGADRATGVVRVNGSAVSLPALTPSATPAPPYASVNVGAGATRLLTPGTYGDLQVKGGVVQLQTGTYVFAADKNATGSVILKSGGVITLAPGAGPVRIYFTGIWDSSGGSIVNTTTRAPNLVIVGTPSVTSVTLVGNTNATFGFYAPTADLKISGGTDISGALVGSTVKITSSTNIHFDTSLSSLSDFSAGSDWALTALHRG